MPGTLATPLVDFPLDCEPRNDATIVGQRPADAAGAQWRRSSKRARVTVRLLLLVLVSAWLTLGWGEGLRIDGEWKEVRYKGRTTYTLVRDSAGVRLRAEARNQNSALFHALPAGAQVHRLRWRWRVLRHPEGADPSVRERDDRAASVFVLVHRSLLPWRTRGLLYQWAPAGHAGRWTVSPYARDIKVLTLEQAPASATWLLEERDLDQDLRTAFGAVPTSIEAIGVLCDSDNTGEDALAEFGELECEVGPPAPARSRVK